MDLHAAFASYCDKVFSVFDVTERSDTHDDEILVIPEHFFPVQPYCLYRCRLYDIVKILAHKGVEIVVRDTSAYICQFPGFIKYNIEKGDYLNISPVFCDDMPDISTAEQPDSDHH